MEFPFYVFGQHSFFFLYNTHTLAKQNAQALSHRKGFDVDADIKIVSFWLIDAFIPLDLMIAKVLLCHRSLALSSS